MKPLDAKPNLRNQQRVDVSSEITLEKPNGRQFQCEIANISRTGVMVQCDAQTAKALIPNMLPPAPKNPVQLTARFPVPVLPAQPVTIVAESNVVHIRRIARDQFHIGLQFHSIEGNGFIYIDQYIGKLFNESRQS
ncbi:MAG: PilZ domain-containing protein [Marinobacter sp.]|uniref:PilZ domain-containing protein n=2 Tax=unclassified Marinobacter TaxID=83889 RepID=UPI00273AD70D|nr:MULTISPECIES: PilZ domain-containing protein [unclassified Marinobacter]MDP4546954.1 PilZ domain-containing protein [Marinobacter sp. MDS2]